MSLPTLENLMKHNKAMAKESLEARDLNNYSICKGWIDCLEYILKYYKLERK